MKFDLKKIVKRTLGCLTLYGVSTAIFFIMMRCDTKNINDSSLFILFASCVITAVCILFVLLIVGLAVFLGWCFRD